MAGRKQVLILRILVLLERLEVVVHAYCKRHADSSTPLSRSICISDPFTECKPCASNYKYGARGDCSFPMLSRNCETLSPRSFAGLRVDILARRECSVSLLEANALLASPGSPKRTYFGDRAPCRKGLSHRIVLSYCIVDLLLAKSCPHFYQTGTRPQ